MGANLGWLYYVDYFRGIDYNDLGADRNEATIQAKVAELLQASAGKTVEEYPYLGNIHFKATTRYPGLVLGTGYPHELPDLNGQAILGFFFDYTTGLPILPGSSVKGVLRNAFAHPDFIASLLKKLTGDKWSTEEVRTLERDIFGNATDDSEVTPGRDIFYDAVIVSAIGRILADDYLTPHGDSITEEPIPLRFIKVAPGVSFRFDFELHDTELDGKVLTIAQKRSLFIELLELLGIGAKTNVGYGHLADFQKIQTEEERKAETARELESKIRKSIEGEDIEIIESLLSTHADHPLVDAMQRRIAELSQQEKFAEIKRAWSNLDHTNRKYVESFIKKYEKEAEFGEYIEKARQLLADGDSQQETRTFEEILEFKKLKDLERFIKSFIAVHPLDEEQKNRLEEHLKTSITDLPKRRKRFPFGTFGDDRCLGKERANRVADDLGL
jgi:CRISPR-associated protein Cmr6